MITRLTSERRRAYVFHPERAAACVLVTCIRESTELPVPQWSRRLACRQCGEVHSQATEPGVELRIVPLD